MKLKVITNKGTTILFNRTKDAAEQLDIHYQNISKYVISTTNLGECKRGRYKGWKFIKLN